MTTPTPEQIRADCQRAKADDKLWRDLARPVLIRATHRWSDEEMVLRQIALKDMRLFAATRTGLVERRRHWLTRRWQIRSVPFAMTPNHYRSGWR